MDTWVNLQKTIKSIFAETKVKALHDVLEEDANGWNWILSFDMLENPTSLILHTKFIFKLDHDKQKLRRNEFLYLYDLNCVYRWQKFTDMTNLGELVNDILVNSRFGKNLLAASEFMVSPSNAVNKYFYDNKDITLSVFEVDYQPRASVIACIHTTLDFKFNVNNKYELYVRVQKDEETEKKEKYELLFAQTEDFADPKVIEIEALTDMAATIAQYMKRNLGK